MNPAGFQARYPVTNSRSRQRTAAPQHPTTQLAFDRVEALSYPSLSSALSANCLALLHRSLLELNDPCMYEVTNRRDAEAIYSELG